VLCEENLLYTIMVMVLSQLFETMMFVWYLFTKLSRAINTIFGEIFSNVRTRCQLFGFSFAYIYDISYQQAKNAHFFWGAGAAVVARAHTEYGRSTAYLEEELQEEDTVVDSSRRTI
jgi:hypothetical protein